MFAPNGCPPISYHIYTIIFQIAIVIITCCRYFYNNDKLNLSKKKVYAPEWAPGTARSAHPVVAALSMRENHPVGTCFNNLWRTTK